MRRVPQGLGAWGELKEQPQSYMEPCFTHDHEKDNCRSFVALLLWMTALRMEEFVGTRAILRADPSTSLRMTSVFLNGLRHD